jgi:predicted transcriptional regulator
VQAQLFCSKLESANIVFVSVDSYIDEENIFRKIQENEYSKFRIYRDESIISQIKERGKIFQTIKDYFKESIKTPKK